MMKVCEICGKGAMFGQNIRHRHSGQWKLRAQRTKRRFLPNLQPVRAQAGPSSTVKLKVCTRCLKAGKVTRA
ncbi:MAG: 50S ribosomal protein L28 [bacterium]